MSGTFNLSMNCLANTAIYSQQSYIKVFVKKQSEAKTVNDDDDNDVPTHGALLTSSVSTWSSLQMKHFSFFFVSHFSFASIFILCTKCERNVRRVALDFVADKRFGRIAVLEVNLRATSGALINLSKLYSFLLHRYSQWNFSSWGGTKSESRTSEKWRQRKRMSYRSIVERQMAIVCACVCVWRWPVAADACISYRFKRPMPYMRIAEVANIPVSTAGARRIQIRRAFTDANCMRLFRLLPSI